MELYFIINVIYACLIYMTMDHKLISYLEKLTPTTKVFPKGFRMNIYILLCFMGSIMFINDFHRWVTNSPNSLWRYRPYKTDEEQRGVLAADKAGDGS
ncbi:hypothetical protein LCGC14_2083320 [marine sediment metagenome]|uniref:Uncharacterized protein n=1 Tax=marine sediment metagenome TaxID=412755 RepID=A0A0F9EET2_9ZZZZ